MAKQILRRLKICANEQKSRVEFQYHPTTRYYFEHDNNKHYGNSWTGNSLHFDIRSLVGFRLIFLASVGDFSCSLCSEGTTSLYVIYTYYVCMYEWMNGCMSPVCPQNVCMSPGMYVPRMYVCKTSVSATGVCKT